MTEEDFLQIVSLHAETYYKPEPPKKGSTAWYDYRRESYAGYVRRSGKKLKEIGLDDVIRQQWSMGGQSGGSCWDDGTEDRHYGVAGEPEPDLADLDTILEHVCPNITYLQYKQLTKGLIEYTDYRENEYYGNYTCYGVKVVKLRNLYDKLKAMELI